MLPLLISSILVIIALTSFAALQHRNVLTLRSRLKSQDGELQCLKTLLRLLRGAPCELGGLRREMDELFDATRQSLESLGFAPFAPELFRRKELSHAYEAAQIIAYIAKNCEGLQKGGLGSFEGWGICLVRAGFQNGTACEIVEKGVLYLTHMLCSKLRSSLTLAGATLEDINISEAHLGGQLIAIADSVRKDRKQKMDDFEEEVVKLSLSSGIDLSLATGKQVGTGVDEPSSVHYATTH